jgi:hypothetical protein
VAPRPFGEWRGSSEKSASARALDRDLAQDGRVHDLVDEAHLEALLRADVPAGEDHVQRALEPDDARQRCVPRARDDAELHLGKASTVLGWSDATR